LERRALEENGGGVSVSMVTASAEPEDGMQAQLVVMVIEVME